jgi:hypothetical protein
VTGRFSLYTDADVNGDLVKALRRAGWDVVRAMNLYPEGTDDIVHFTRAAQMGRVLVACDRDQLGIAAQWLAEGRPFRGLISWPQSYHPDVPIAAFVKAFEALAEQPDDPFTTPRVIELEPRLE